MLGEYLDGVWLKDLYYRIQLLSFPLVFVNNFIVLRSHALNNEAIIQTTTARRLFQTHFQDKSKYPKNNLSSDL